MQRAEWCRRVRGLSGAIGAVAVIAVAMPGANAHKGMASPFTYSEHVFPILRDRCGSCHYDGGPTPMALLRYQDAQPWAEAIREQLISEAMPPWYADPAGPALSGGHTISPRELDILMMWAGGGTPPGDITPAPEPALRTRQWKLGAPDLTLTISPAQVLPATTTEETRDVVVATGLTQMKWVRATDLLPGDPSMVRDAVVQAENGDVLALWGPGDDAMPAPRGAVFALAAGARLRLRIHYKKNYRDDRRAMEDRSQIGLYFAASASPGDRIHALDLASDHTGAGPERQLAVAVTTAIRVVALRPLLDRHYQSIAVDAVLPTGRRPLLRLRSARAGWARRYWLNEPVDVPPGARIEVIAITAPSAPGGTPAPGTHPLRVSIDFIARDRAGELVTPCPSAPVVDCR